MPKPKLCNLRLEAVLVSKREGSERNAEENRSGVSVKKERTSAVHMQLLDELRPWEREERLFSSGSLVHAPCPCLECSC